MTGPSYDFRSGDDRLQVVSLTLAGLPPIESVPDPPQDRRRVESRFHAITRPKAAPELLGPPTEALAPLGPSAGDGRDGRVLDPDGLARRCRDAAAPALLAGDRDVTVSLRVFVLPDGRIAQGQIERSSGDEEIDRAVFRCVQAYASVEPLVVDDGPVGSWQIVTTAWAH